MSSTALARILTLAVVLSAQPAWAYLGGFEVGDGYDNGNTPIGSYDVSAYNAGEYGTNAGGPGGAFTLTTPNSGLFTKLDQGDISPGYGELVGHDTIAHSGLGSLVLRSNLGWGDTAGDGADYLYNFDRRDFGGISPTLITSGIVSMNYWMCPQVSFFANGTVASTSFLNTAGDTIFAIGCAAQGGLNADPLIEYQDATGWHTTSIVGNHNGWDRILLSFDLDTDKVSFSYYSSITGLTTILASGVGTASALDAVSAWRLQANANSPKVGIDDVSIVVAVPEPSSLLAIALGAIPCLMRRRRK